MTSKSNPVCTRKTRRKADLVSPAKAGNGGRPRARGTTTQRISNPRSERNPASTCAAATRPPDVTARPQPGRASKSRPRPAAINWTRTGSQRSAELGALSRQGAGRFALGIFSLLIAGCASNPPPSPGPGEVGEDGESLARFEPSPPEIVRLLLDVAGVSEKDTLYDLGSGDGRIVIQAARERGARGVGIELEPDLVRLAGDRAKEAGVESRVTFVQGDLLKADISPATVVTLFLSARAHAQLEPRLRRELRPGTRVVSHCHGFPDWNPEKTVPITLEGRQHLVYLWRVESAETTPNLGPFVPTPLPVVTAMLELAGVTSKDTVYDLGCGDGRVVIEAAKRHGARGIGLEYDARLVTEARDRATREGVADRVEIRHEDVTRSDFSDATVVALYLLPGSNERLRPKLAALPRGTRVVAHDFQVAGWSPAARKELWLRDETERHEIFLYRVGEEGATAR